MPRAARAGLPHCLQHPPRLPLPLRSRLWPFPRCLRCLRSLRFLRSLPWPCRLCLPRHPSRCRPFPPRLRIRPSLLRRSRKPLRFHPSNRPPPCRTETRRLHRQEATRPSQATSHRGESNVLHASGNDSVDTGGRPDRRGRTEATSRSQSEGARASGPVRRKSGPAATRRRMLSVHRSRPARTRTSGRRRWPRTSARPWWL